MDYYGIQYEPEMIEKANFYTLRNTDPSQSLKINVSYLLMGSQLFSYNDADRHQRFKVIYINRISSKEGGSGPVMRWLLHKNMKSP